MRSRKLSTSISLTPCRPATNGSLCRIPAGALPAGSSRAAMARKSALAAMPQDQRMRHRVAERADAELQRAAVGDGARDVDADGVLGEIDGLARRREQGKVGGRRPPAEGRTRLAAMSPSPGMNGSSELTCPTNRKSHWPRARRRQQIEREVGVAAQAQPRLAAAHALGDELRHHVHPAVEHIAQRMGVVGGNVILLRGGDAEPGAGLEEEFVDRDVRRERARMQRRGIGELRVAGEDALARTAARSAARGPARCAASPMSAR